MIPQQPPGTNEYNQQWQPVDATNTITAQYNANTPSGPAGPAVMVYPNNASYQFYTAAYPAE